MSRVATAAYLQHLRELRGLTRGQVARLMGVSEMMIYRIENATQDPKADMLMAFVEAIGGDVYDVYELLLAKNATHEDGVQRAHERAVYSPAPLPDTTLLDEIDTIRRRLAVIEQQVMRQQQATKNQAADQADQIDPQLGSQPT